MLCSFERFLEITTTKSYNHISYIAIVQHSQDVGTLQFLAGLLSLSTGTLVPGRAATIVYHTAPPVRKSCVLAM